MTPEFHAPRNPRTRRQLREALQSAKNRATALEQAIEAAGLEVRTATTAYSNGFTFFDAEIVDAISLKEHSRRVEAGIIEARADARRETLEKVIEALELPGYAAGGLFHPYDRSKNRTLHDTDRLWADIQTALEVRAEQKQDAEREATAEKVAGLTKPKSFENTFGFTFARVTEDFDAEAPKVSDVTPKKKPAAKKSTKGEKK